MSPPSSHLVKATVLLTLAAATLAFSAPAIADRPTEVPVLDVFTGVNACTGLEGNGHRERHDLPALHGDLGSHHFARHDHHELRVRIGRGTASSILHERIFVVNGMLTNDASRRRASVVQFVAFGDASSEFRVLTGSPASVSERNEASTQRSASLAADTAG